MATNKISDYERKRLETIRRNNEMMASLSIHSKAGELSSSVKRQRTETKSYKRSPVKKPKTPVVIRRSLRTRGIDPDYLDGVKDDLVVSQSKTPQHLEEPSLRQVHHLNAKDAYRGANSVKSLLKTIISASNKSQIGFIDILPKDEQLSDLVDESDGGYFYLTKGVSQSKMSNGVVKRELNKVMGSVNLNLFTLEPENVARVMPGRILNVKFFPSTSRNMIAAGNKFGDVAFWDINSVNEDGDGIYLYHPHSAPISGISVQPFALSKIITSCYDGMIRLMDAEKEVFNLLYSSDDAIFSLSQRPNDINCLYFGEGHGVLNIWDERAGKSSSSLDLHEGRINSIDFNSDNPNFMVTSSTDRTACIWDLRNIDAGKSKTLKTVQHERAVHSAYFSPSGGSIATTGIDDKIGIVNGVNYEDVAMIDHFNQTSRWISSFRGIWGWDDSYVFLGNMKRAIDVISSAKRQTIMTLHSGNMSAIPCRFDAHPYNVGMLAGATAGGQVYLWTSP